MKKLIVILCFLIVGCCPFCNSDCFYTIEKDENVEPIEKYRDTEYYLSFSSYDFENDSLQEKFYNAFRLYIDSVNVYNLEMPVSVDAFITAEGTTQKIDSSLVEYRTVIRGMLGIFIYRKFIVFPFNPAEQCSAGFSSAGWMTFPSAKSHPCGKRIALMEK